MPLLYRYRHLVSWVLTLLAASCIPFISQRHVPAIQLHPDEAVTELALVAPEPEPLPAPDPEPVPPEPVTPPVIEQEDAPPAPEPIPKPRPKPRPVSRPEHRSPAPSVAPSRKVPAAPSPPVESPKPVVSPPVPAAPVPVAPKVNAHAIEGSYLQALRHELEQYKRYPTGRQASLEQPQGSVEVWLDVDRSGHVLASGISSKAASMLLNRAATTTLQSINQVQPFPTDAFAGQASKRFTVTFEYQAP